MASLPAYSGKEVVRIFEKVGWQLARQRGRHMILVKAGSIVTLSYLIIAKSPKGRYAA
jgi:predicted RNA binding protein YcfA (HicA-like mRNA interferase family)